MENIVGLFGAVGIIILICAGIAALLFPIMFEIQFRAEYGKDGISSWWTVCQIIGILGTASYMHDTTSDGFYEALGFMAIVFVVAVIRNYKRIKKLGCDKSLCRLGATAQFVAPLGVLFIIFIISGLFDKDKDKK